MLLLNKLKKINLIPLVVTEKEPTDYEELIKCKPCKKHLISRQKIEEIKSFNRWWERKSFDYDIKLRYSIQSESDLEADKITAKLVSFMVLIKFDFEGAFL